MPSFDEFWRNHPALQNPPITDPSTTNGKPNHTNQCCIRLGVALTKSGMGLATYPGVFCWSGHGKTHPLRVEEMKYWLNSSFGNADISRTRPQKTYNDYLGRKGIVACLNFWGDGNQGDHIDLWDGDNLAHGGRDYFERSEEIWYWRVA